jgi:hydrogenase/urease accessory protein HupE
VRVKLHAVSVAAVALLTSARSAQAHEGHGDPALFNSVLHLLIEPVHLPLTVGLVAVVAAAWWMSSRPSHAARARRR